MLKRPYPVRKSRPLTLIQQKWKEKKWKNLRKRLRRPGPNYTKGQLAF
jgi:hypothetical protein